MLEIVDAILLDEDLQVSDAVSPLLDLLYKQMKENPSLSDARNAAFCSVLEFFTKRPSLAQVGCVISLLPFPPDFQQFSNKEATFSNSNGVNFSISRETEICFVPKRLVVEICFL